MIILVTLILGAGLFLLDLKMPSGAGEWGLYLIPLLLAFRARQSWYPLVFAGVCTVLLAAGFMISPLGAVAREWVAVNRMVGVAVLWIAAALLIQRKRAEQSLMQNEERFRAIAEESLMGTYIIQDDRFLYVNRTFAEMLGYSVPELLARPSVVDMVAKEDMSKVRENLHRRLSGEVNGLRYQARAIRKDGSTFTCEANGCRVELNGKPAIVGMLQDVSEREQSEAVITRTSEQLQTLSRRLLELQEAERRNIARELHDEIGQALTALKINLQAVQRLSGAAAFAPRLLDSISIVDRTLRQVRSLSLDLRPSMLDDLGLNAALRWYSDQQAQRAGLRIQFVAGELGGRLEMTLETTCFRVAQEAMTNIVRHAKASSVQIVLEPQGGMLHLAVCDDGIGFDLARLHRQAAKGKSLGLLGMEERASLLGGRVEWRTAPQEGTEVHAWFPLVLAPAPANVEGDLAVK